jgi:TonB-linked SusC/RagA family outer membrane protein
MMCNVVEVDANNRNVSFAQTDFNGNFSMTVKSTKNKLKISYVGYKTAILPIGTRTTFNVKLQSATQIKEVQVVAKRKFNQGGLAIPEREVSVAAQTFDMSKVDGLAFTTADEALQGQIAGLDIVANSGNLGAGTSMRLRGVTSINGSAEPLIVVDGNIFDNPDENFDFQNANEETYASLLSVNPSDIEDIQVLKDAAATAIWGSRGANGVIQIRTKRGARGATRVDYSLRLQASWQPKGYNLLNGDDYTMMLKEMFYNPAQSASATTNINEINYSPSWAEKENWNNNTDWVKEVQQVGWSQYHYLTISGGGEKANFRISAGYDHQNGTIIEQRLDRFTTKLALDYFVSDRITFRTTFPLTYTNNHRNYDDNILGRAQKMAPNMSVYRQDANGNDTDEFYVILPLGSSNDAGSSLAGTSSKQLEGIRSLGNPVAIANLAWRDEKTYRISPEFRLDYYLLGKDDSKTRLDYTGLVYMDIFSKSEPKYWPGSLSTDGWNSSNYNRSQVYDYNSLAFTTRHTMTFNPHFANEDFYSTMLARWEMTSGNDNNQTVVTRNAPNGTTSPTVDADMQNPSAGNGQWRSMSMTYSGHFSYLSRYAFDFSVRADGTTKFGDSKKWGWFPGVSARWNISDEPFMKWSKKFLTMLSFRPSWGIVGRQPGSQYLQYAKYNTSGVYGSINDTRSVTYLEGLQLNRLQWERTTQYNLGGDFGFFDRITGDFNYYFKRTKDLLMSGVGIPSTSGFGSLAWANVGEMTNKGWELNIQANKVIEVGKFNMGFNFNISQNFNEIVDMDESVLQSINSEWDSSKRDQYLNRIQKGNPLGSIYGLRYKGVYQYTYEYLINMKTREGWTGEQLRDYINNTFLAQGKTAPIAIDNNGKVMMDSRGNPIRMVYNFTDGSSTYKFQGGDAIYEDVNNDGQINSLDIVYLGNSNPHLNGGFGFNINYDAWSLRTNFSYRQGVKVVNRAKMGLEQMFNAYNQSSAVNWRWRKNGDVTEIPRAMYDTGYNFLGSDRYVEDASFVRMSYVQLVYTFKKQLLKQLGLRRLQVSLSGQNLLCWSKYSGTDPEHSAGSWGIAYDNSQTPRSKSVTMNVQVGF